MLWLLVLVPTGDSINIIITTITAIISSETYLTINVLDSTSRR